MSSTEPPRKDAPLVEVVNDEASFTEAYKCVSAAFGTQVHDAIWEAFNPGWDTAAGQAAGAARMVRRWQGTTRNKDGERNTVFLKATLPGPDGRNRVTAGFAIWVQISAVEGHGDTALGALGDEVMQSLYPDNEKEQRFLKQMFDSLFKARVAFVRGTVSKADPPAVMALDLCATHPDFQRRGVASSLVRWGMEETRRRGIRYATIEASAMGRLAYATLGFKPQGGDFVYEVDDEFADRGKPPNVFMVWDRQDE
ncbi:acyl-CoA N-acyltransferase [Xylaria arbuscula]|nr:acyl-CoA N-acyltransferase [Xylaria arbuscula]